MRERISENFYLSEFKCKCKRHCKGSNPMPPTLLVNILELTREKVNKRVSFNFKMKITSAFRCKYHNKEEGGGRRSQHLKNYAVDFRDYLKRVDTEILRDCAYEAMRELGAEGGIGIYNTFLHVDIRGYSAKWDLRTK